MAREIRFRVFATDNEFPEGKMYYPETLGKLDPNRGFVINQFGDLIHTRHERDHYHAMIWARVGFNIEGIMQYTGLKDKNGKEIYEGDVLGRWEDEAWSVFGKVTYGNAPNCLITGQYYLADEKGFISDWGLEDDAMPSNWHNLEVVGNALEHPKLLKEATNG